MDPVLYHVETTNPPRLKRTHWSSQGFQSSRSAPWRCQSGPFSTQIPPMWADRGTEHPAAVHAGLLCRSAPRCRPTSVDALQLHLGQRAAPRAEA
eukprot:67310-Chlamydomonas_euryale.AAC.1